MVIVIPLDLPLSKAWATRGRIDRLNRRRVTNQADSRWTGDDFLFIRDRWRVPPKSSTSAASAKDSKEHFLAGYLNCSCLQNKRVLLNTFIGHLSRKQTLVSQGTSVWHHGLACRKPWRCVRLDYRSCVAKALHLCFSKQAKMNKITIERVGASPDFLFCSNMRCKVSAMHLFI